MFKKVVWNKGLTKETDERVRAKSERAKKNPLVVKNALKALEKAVESNIGRKHSKKWRKNQSDGMKGIKKTKEHIEKIAQSNRGRKDSAETRLKKSKARIGKKNPNYIDGRSYKPYTEEWTKKLRKEIKERDNYRCQLCGKTREEQNETDSLKRGLTVHHIDYNKENCSPKNLITLCRRCNSIVNFSREDWIKFFQKKIQDNDIV